MQQVMFRLLGPPEVYYNEQPIRIPRRRSRALLYYMVSTHTPQPRERLMALLCGDMDDESARRAFKTMLAEVRSQLRSVDPSIEWITSDEDRLTFHPLAPIWLDTEIFEKATANVQSNLSLAIKLYRNKFLDGFFLKGAPDFDTWVQSTRDHFHHLYMQSLHHMAEVYEANHQLQEAITCTHRLLEADPLSEEAHAQLMRLYWQAGDRTLALRQYERLGKVLAEEFSVQPLAATKELYQQIARSTSVQAQVKTAPVHPVLPPARALQVATETPVVDVTLPFVGRVRELDWLRNHLFGQENEQTLLLLQGEIGIGKTRLLQEITEGDCASWLVLQGTCQEAEGKNSYHPLLEALRSGLDRQTIARLDLYPVWQARLERLLPDLFYSAGSRNATEAGHATDPGHSSGDGTATLLADALVALLNQLATPQRPVLLLLDDIHWCDKATLGLLAHLIRYVRRREVFLLGTYSPGGGEKRLLPLRNNAARLGLLAEIELEPLSRSDIHQLVTQFNATEASGAGRQSAGLTPGDWCYQHSEGNPLYTLAWLEAGWGPAEAAVPARLEALIHIQVGRLSQSARHLLQLAACGQDKFDLAQIGLQLGYTPAQTLSASAELITQRFISADPDSSTSPGIATSLYTFVHHTARSCVLNSMTAIERQVLQTAARSMANTELII
ncbi:hypothetical protein KDW_21750 [Dictyobacter vulcani]|uniref:Bacterial transcriptional activator domain-containing protein n=1 Tax=Dictyobacter vulcani TaxID=2607529 RepID=A0A5J4KJT9_9CHLR|nr:AAA family ATPase [Dictyobacter vulcani]GER88013.1 hypothetical protein KDW_21750 [Dictyobacter vulcani]